MIGGLAVLEFQSVCEAPRSLTCEHESGGIPTEDTTSPKILGVNPMRAAEDSERPGAGVRGRYKKLTQPVKPRLLLWIPPCWPVALPPFEELRTTDSQMKRCTYSMDARLYLNTGIKMEG